MQDSPVGYWRLDESSGSSADDTSGAGNTGALSGNVTLGSAGLLASDVDSAMQFSGGGVLLPTSTGLTFGASDSFSVEAWIKTTAAGMVFSQQQCGPSAIQLYVSGGSAIFRVYGPSGPEVDVSGGAVNDGSPHHLVGVRDTAAQVVSLYVDSVLVQQLSDTTQGALTVLPNQTWIGERYWCGSTDTFSGTIDEVAVYRTALSSGRVSTHFSAGGGPLQPPGVPQSSTYGQAVMSATPVSYWRLDDQTGNDVQDATGHGHVGLRYPGVTMHAPGLLTDAADSSDAAMSFSGGNIQIPTTADLTFGPTDGFSIEAWVETTSSGSADILNQGQCTNAYIDVGQSGSAAGFWIRDSNGTSVGVTGGSITDGQPHHLVAVRDATAHTAQLYVDGVQVGIAADSTTASLTAPVTQTWIGKQYDCGGTWPFSGTIDEVAIYRSVLSPSVIATHFSAGGGPLQPPGVPQSSAYGQAVMSASPVSYWRLDDQIGNDVQDATGHGNVGFRYPGVTPNATGLLADASDTSDSAMHFSGGAIQVPTTPDLRFGHTDSFSFEAWVEIPASGGGGNILTESQCTPANVSLGAGSAASFYIRDTNSTSAVLYGGSIADGQPHHVVGLRDATTSTIQLYVDGVQVGTTADTTTASLSASSTQMWIGKQYDCGGTGLFTGTIDDVAIYRSALSASDVQSHFRFGSNEFIQPVTVTSSQVEPDTMSVAALPTFSTLCSALVSPSQGEGACIESTTASAASAQTAGPASRTVAFAGAEPDPQTRCAATPDNNNWVWDRQWLCYKALFQVSTLDFETGAVIGTASYITTASALAPPSTGLPPARPRSGHRPRLARRALHPPLAARAHASECGPPPFRHAPVLPDTPAHLRTA